MATRRYPDIPFGTRVKNRIRNETKDLIKSILEYVNKTELAKATTVDQMMEVLSNTDFKFIAAAATEGDKKLLFESISKHPLIQKSKIRTPQFKRDKERSINDIQRNILKRNPSFSKTKARRLATIKWSELDQKRRAKAKIKVEQNIDFPVKQWQRLKAAEPSFRAERYLRQKSKTGKYYNRVKPIKWTSKQLNFIRSKKGQDKVKIVEEYNRRFKTKRTASSIINRLKRI